MATIIKSTWINMNNESSNVIPTQHMCILVEETIQIKGSVNSPRRINEYAHETLRHAWTNAFTSPTSRTSRESFFHLSTQHISSERSGKYSDFSLTNTKIVIEYRQHFVSSKRSVGMVKWILLDFNVTN